MTTGTMTQLFLVGTGRTTWEDQARVESTTGAPLSAAGAREVTDAAGELRKKDVTVIYAGDGEAERQTAKLIGDVLGTKVRPLPDLREIDYGLWQGLTVEEIKRRQPRVYRQWTDDPTSICPPGGETVQEVADRLRRALRAVLKRHRNGVPLLVLRPVALALCKCVLADGKIENIRTKVDRGPAWTRFEANPAEL
jgi:broad specificity phosphatase PhoE